LAIGSFCLLWIVAGEVAPARADDAKQESAKALYESAMAEFGLGNFAKAAEQYEEAFRLRPDQALLYNAAQSHRLAGNRKRALDLYRNFIRLYGRASPMALDAKRRIDELERAAAEDDGATPAPASPSVHLEASGPTSHPPETAPPITAQPAVAPATTPTSQAPMTAKPDLSPPAILGTPSPASSAEPQVAAASTPAAARRSILSSRWYWGGAGAVVLVGALVILAVLPPSYPDANLGHATLGR
jgi:hypothetical protein